MTEEGWGRVTWVNSQWKLRTQMGHFWVQINSNRPVVTAVTGP